MTWIGSVESWWIVGAIGGGALSAFLWWALADLFFATVELPFAAMLSRWRARRMRSDERDRDASARGEGPTAQLHAR